MTIALVTGATGGIGRNISLCLGSEGYELVLMGRNKAKLASLKDELSGEGVAFVKCFDVDFCDDISLKKTLINISNEVPRIDVIVNSAGIFPVQSFLSSDVSDFEKCMAVNVKAPFVIVKHFMESMIDKGYGRIINIASSSAYCGFANTSIYCTSKHALLGFSRSCNDEFKSRGVWSYCLSPGSVKTEMGKKVRGQDFSTFIEPEEVAQQVVFLLKQRGSMMTDEVRMNRVRVQ